MATIALLDYRRTDPRKQTLENSFWLTSKSFGLEVDDKAALLFSFPTKPVPDNLDPYSTYAPAGDLGYAGKYYLIETAAVEIQTAFAGGTVVLNIGVGTIATDAAVDGDDITYTNLDDIVPTAAITNGTPGIYLPTFNGSSAAIYHYKLKIVCADASTPCLFAALSSNDTITAGKARVHFKVSRIGDVPRS
jgi:hypothetical protein